MAASLKKLHRGWIMVGAGIITCAAAIGLVGNCYSLFIVPVCDEMGFTRSQMSANQTIFGIGMMLVALLWGPVFSKLRLKRLMNISAIATCVCYFINGFARNLYMFYAMSVVLAFTTALLSWSPLTVIIGNWFNKKRGLAIGLTFMGSGIGGMLFNAIGGVLIDNMGWRYTFMVFAVIMAVTMLPTVLFVIKIKPEDVGAQPYGGDAGDAANGGEKPGVPFAKAMRDKRMYLLLGSLLLLGFTFNSMNVTTAPNMRALGYSAVYSANIASAYMASLAVAKIVLGAMCDKIGTWKGCAIALFAQFIAAICAMFATNLGVVAVFVVCNGLGTAFGSVAFPLIARDLYGERDQASVSSIFNAVCSLTGAIGPTLCGMVYDITGAYTPSYGIIAAVTLVFGAVFIFSVARGSGKWKQLQA